MGEILNDLTKSTGLIESILEKGNSVELKKNKDGLLILEVERKIRKIKVGKLN